ncbi:MAG: hypothetical protein R3E76_11955 [Planctomycetota bacterium]
MKGMLDGVYTFDLDETPPDTLIPKEVYFVRVAGFTFQFLALRHLEIALSYFCQPFQKEGKIKDGLGSADHWEVQRWFERLPKGLERKSRRADIAKALRNALEDFAP